MVFFGGIIPNFAKENAKRQYYVIRAERLCLSLPTIKWYRKRMKVKFDATTTVQMVRKAIEAGII